VKEKDAADDADPNSSLLDTHTKFEPDGWFLISKSITENGRCLRLWPVPILLPFHLLFLLRRLLLLALVLVFLAAFVAHCVILSCGQSFFT
jgi:hypothetical protein